MLISRISDCLFMNRDMTLLKGVYLVPEVSYYHVRTPNPITFIGTGLDRLKVLVVNKLRL